MSSPDSPCQTVLKFFEIHARHFLIFLAFYSPLLMVFSPWSNKVICKVLVSYSYKFARMEGFPALLMLTNWEEWKDWKSKSFRRNILVMGQPSSISCCRDFREKWTLCWFYAKLKGPRLDTFTISGSPLVFVNLQNSSHFCVKHVCWLFWQHNFQIWQTQLKSFSAAFGLELRICSWGDRNIVVKWKIGCSRPEFNWVKGGRGGGRFVLFLFCSWEDIDITHKIFVFISFDVHSTCFFLTNQIDDQLTLKFPVACAPS